MFSVFLSCSEGIASKSLESVEEELSDTASDTGLQSAGHKPLLSPKLDCLRENGDPLKVKQLNNGMYKPLLNKMLKNEVTKWSWFFNSSMN